MGRFGMLASEGRAVGRAFDARRITLEAGAGALAHRVAEVMCHGISFAAGKDAGDRGNCRDGVSDPSPHIAYQLALHLVNASEVAAIRCYIGAIGGGVATRTAVIRTTTTVTTSSTVAERRILAAASIVPKVGLTRSQL